jgi:hypothetical protein
VLAHLLLTCVEIHSSQACWFNLQFSWLHHEVPSVAKSMEISLHSMLPPISSSIISYHITRLLMDYWGIDRVATFLPHLFAMLMMAGMLALGCTPSSFVPQHSQEESLFLTSSYFSISSLGARGHSMLLLLAPGTIHVLMFRQRILSRHAASDELYDLVLVWAIPYLLHCGILLLHKSKCPYEISNKLFPNVKENTLRGTLVPIMVSLLASLAAQQRYIIPVCTKISYQFNGHDLPPTWIISIYLTMATCATLFALWTWGRRSFQTGELLFGEYHEDVVQLSVSASGLLLGKAFGFPWNLTPLPILAFLGLSVWATTRMLRYLTIFLFVVHAGSVVLFSYRFASIDIKIPLAIPGIEVNLIRFGTIEVISSVLVALVAGFAVRPPGGVGAAFLKRVDVPGMIFIVYELFLIVLEITLLKRPAPQELVGQESDVGVEDAGYLYDHATALLTSVAIVAVTLFTQRLKIISTKASIVALSLSIAKAVSVVIDANESDGKIRTEGKEEQLAQRVFFRTMVAAFLLIVMMAPRAILSPIHIKTPGRHKRSLADGKPIGSIPSTALRNIVIYTMVVLPASLLSAVPMVLTPLVMALSSHYGGGAYYKVAPPLSEMAGFALTLWGIASLSMINFYLPDGGAETWKKASALTLLMGIGVTFSAPTVPDWIVGDSGLGVSNPYASISSLGTTLATQGRNRTGGWGILSASLATLLAITGPLELRERRHPSGRKDQYLLLRLMIFSLLFGSGVAWFITIQSMGQAKFIELLMTGLACMVVSFFGTVTCVLGYFLELENFNEVDQMAKIWVGAFGLFGLVTGMPVLFSSSTSMHAFGAGGWLSTYLAVSSLAAFSLTMALRLRSTNSQGTRGLANASCVLSYMFAILVLYGRYGVSGMDDTFTVTTVLGVPASVLGTFLVAPMLLALEGESSSERRSRVSRISAGGSRPPASTIGLPLPNLSASNRFAPPVAATFLVFFVAALYAIFLRGSFLFGSVSTSHYDHYDLISKVSGGNSAKLAKLAQRSVSHSLSLVVSARLAGSGFWTASNPLGPLIHLGGLVATVPSVFVLLSHMWRGLKVPKSQVIVALPVNLIPLLFCRGVPAIRAAAMVGSIGGLLQLLNMHRSDRRSQMRI